MINWVYRELRQQNRFIFLFILNLSLGLTGFLCLDAFKVSLQKSLATKAKSFLSADLAVTVRRQFSESEIEAIRQTLPEDRQEGRLWEMFSMVSSETNSRLVQMKIIDRSYPFYGDLEMGSGRKITGPTEKEILSDAKVWVYPELLSQLNLKIGDNLKIGEAVFQIADTVVDDSTQTFRLASIAPRVFLSFDSMKKSKLLSFGSTMSDALLFQFKKEQNLDGLKKNLSLVLKDPALQIITPEEAGQDSVRSLSYLTDYLGLVSLVALFLAALGSSYLFRSYFSQKMKSIAIYNVLGLSRRRAQLIYLLQLSLLGFAASLLSLMIASALLPILAQLLNQVSPVEVALYLPPKTIFLGIFLGSFGSFLICYPFLRALGKLKLTELFHEESSFSYSWDWKDLLGFIPTLACFYFLSVWQANSWKIGSSFFAMLLISMLVFVVLGWLLIRSLKVLTWVKSWPLRQACLSLSRRPVASLAGLTALSIGTLLMNFIPHLKTTLQDEMERPNQKALPSLFLFDIQDEQLQPLQKFLQQRGIQEIQPSAMVRARILKINDSAYERAENQSTFQTREEENEMRFRNRGVNLSYRDKLLPSETIVDGEPIPGSFNPEKQKWPLLSIEFRYADRMKLKIGDLVTFDIQGVEIQGQVANLRRVKWNSFQPNFFIQFQPGVLDEAPKTFLMSLPAMGEEQKNSLQNDLVKDFSNVSMVDVSRTVAKIFDLADKMSWSLQLMAALSIFAGLIVLYSVCNHQVHSRRWDLNLFKIMGASPIPLQASLLFEFALLSLCGAILGLVLSLVATAILAAYLFESSAIYDLSMIPLSLIFIPVLGLSVAWIASRQVLAETPASLLQEARL